MRSSTELARWIGRAARTSPGVLGLLLLLRVGLPESGLVLNLSGKGRIDAELALAQTRGYYEELIGPADRARLTAPDVRPESDIERPPPGWVTFSDSGIDEHVPEYVRSRLKPGVDATWNGLPFKTNSHGHRGPEVSVAKPPGTYRVVVLGSSNTMGHGVGDEDVYVRLFGSWLDQAVQGLGLRAEVLNLSVSGHSPSQRLWRLMHEVEAFQPDWVICDATVLDVSLEAMHLESIVSRGVPIPLDYVRKALASVRATTADAPEVFRGKVRGAYRELLGGAYAGWAAESKRLGVPLTVLLIPRADNVGSNPELVRLTHALAARNGLDLIDVFEAFGTMSLEEFRVAPWDRHPTSAGHRAIFTAWRDEVLERGGCPGLPIPRETTASAEPPGGEARTR